MTEARIVVVTGYMLSAVLATWLTTVFYEHLVAIGSLHFSADPGIWWWIGIPFALSTGAAALIVTRREIWLPARWSWVALTTFALRSVMVATLISGVVLMLVGFVVILALAGAPIHGSQRGVPTYIGGISLLFLVTLFVVMQIGILHFARYVASAVERGDQEFLKAKERYGRHQS